MDVERNELNTAGAAISAANRRSGIIKALTANDITYWGADAFISVALALFVVSYIEAATILNVGLALMIYRVVGALSAVPVGRWFDTHRGYLDEVRGLSFACFGAGFTYILLSFSTTIWQLYVAMFFLGIFATINVSSWRILFYSNIVKRQFGQTIGVYQMLYSLGIGLFLAVGGFVGERYGYDTVLLMGGFLMMFGSLLPLLIRGYFGK
jgi:MFS family permease